jgi:hypothetical protein
LAALCGFVIEGWPPEDMPDPYRVPLVGFRPGGPKLTLERSHGRRIVQPSALDVEAQVRRLGTGLDYVIVDKGGENYVQAAVGAHYGVPAGAFHVERREGGPDVHFRCEVNTVEDVVEVFRGYHEDQDGWGDHDWQQIWL